MSVFGHTQHRQAGLREEAPGQRSKQNERRPFLPATLVPVEAAINNLVLREFARSRRRKAEVQTAVWLSTGMKSGPLGNGAPLPAADFVHFRAGSARTGP